MSRVAGSALVIGGAGFLGTGIVRELLAAGWHVTALGRGNKPLLVDGVPYLRADRATPGALAQATQGQAYDLVVDCAAYKEEDAAGALTAFAGRTGHYVFISTDFVYSRRIDGPFPIAEDAPKEESLAYGVGKLAAEARLLRAWAEARFPATILRPPHIMGAGKELGSGSVQGRDVQLLERLRAGDAEGVTLLSEGQLLIQPVWHREVGACIAHVARDERAFGQVFNCAGPDCVTTRRYYQLIADRLGVPLRAGSLDVRSYLERWPERAPFARHRIYDMSRLAAATGYQPRFRLEEAIAETVAWMEQAGPPA
ncbi:MAG TPA: NAD-dependent epimerase/dehydratase family protein [Chloroflexota bacterium]|nr:NAD-dependent epimerase/dehydratase family protein [Chloroflexota bacterium]